MPSKTFTPEQAAKRLATSLAWAALHPERVRAAQKAYYHRNKAKRLAYDRSPMGRYNKQRSKAAQRGIEWQFTFDTWIAWWGDDYSRRGGRRGDLCMARRGDTGPYSPENTYKTTMAANASDAEFFRRQSK